MTEAYRKIITGIVEGQVKNFIDGHPDILNCVLWFKTGDRKKTLTTSISKRIIQQLTSEENINNIRIALADGLLPGQQGTASSPIEPHHGAAPVPASIRKDT